MARMRIWMLCIQHVKERQRFSRRSLKDRTFEGIVFPFRHDKVTMLFPHHKGIIYTKSPHYQTITRAKRKKEKERDFT